jgi:hypothetical protein
MPAAGGSPMGFKGRQPVCRVWTQTGVSIFDFGARRDRTTALLLRLPITRLLYIFSGILTNTRPFHCFSYEYNFYARQYSYEK